MAISIIILLAGCFLAYTNGANDNFKGVATLFGSKTTNYRTAIWWATITTFAGSIASIFLAGTLVARFSGKGLVPDSIAASPNFLLAVTLAAAITVLLATLTGFPISTTHALTGALVGSGLVAVGTQVNFAVLGSAFFLPLLLSPVIAVVLASLAYLLFRTLRIQLGITKASPANPKGTAAPHASPSALSFSAFNPATTVNVLTENIGQERYVGSILGIDSHTIINVAHYISAGIMSFARGLNDTPKLLALLVAIKLFNLQVGAVAIALGMAAGGLINARRVAETMSKKITPLNPGQGFTANFITGLLVVLASRFGLPVSTTHVSVGSIFGIGLVTKQANTRVVLGIILSWILTLPIAIVLSMVLYWLLSR